MGFSLRLLQIDNESAARREVERIGADPQGVSRMSAKMVPRLIKLSQVPCRAANILKQEMLALGGDAAVARGTVACSISATDVILIGSLKQLRRLGSRLAHQPFGLADCGVQLQRLLALLDESPPVLVGRSCRLNLDRPLIMGILNVTPDSFSDGGRFADAESALRRGLVMAAEGADLIDIGGESTRPGAPAVALQEELDRVLPVIEALRRECDIPLSIDTNKAAVAAAAIADGAEFINDISGLQFDPKMATTVADGGAGLFVMHTRGRPEQMQKDTVYPDLLAAVVEGLRDSLRVAIDAGVAEEKLAVDPGIGFGKSAGGNLELLQRLGELHGLGRPVLLGTSRKGFIGRVTGRSEPTERLYGTLATVALGVQQGVQLFRVHDVGPARDAARMAWAIRCAAMPQCD
jgi:dihydropteroate synthase